MEEMQYGDTLDIAVFIKVPSSDKKHLLDVIKDIAPNFGADAYGFEVRGMVPPQSVEPKTT